ncbi:hypothetical protein ABPG72_006105 [Tetrahymena utriculariae]
MQTNLKPPLEYLHEPDSQTTQQKQQSIFNSLIGKSTNKKNRVLIFLGVQIICLILTTLILAFLYIFLSKNFIFGFYYLPLVIIYCIPLLFIYVYSCEINLVLTVQVISICSLFIYMTVFILIYVGVFQPIFNYRFDRFQQNCTIEGVKTINLHSNEKYSIVYVKFQDESGSIQYGQACASNNIYSSLFETNIQPYRFIPFNDTYYALNQDQNTLRYTFSQAKIPSWFCMQDTQLQSILKSNGSDQFVFPVCRVNLYQQQVYTYQQGVSDIQNDDNFFIVSLSQKDPYFNQALFVILIILAYQPLTFYSPQFIVLYLIIKASQMQIFKKKQKQKQFQNSSNRVSIINLQKVRVESDKISEQIQENDCDSEKQNNQDQQKQANMNTKSKLNTQTQTTAQQVIINNNHTNNENINLIFNNNKIDNHFYFKQNNKSSPNQQQSPIVQKFFKRYSVSLKDEKSKRNQQKHFSSCDISNQSISINYYHENTLFHLEQYNQLDIPNPLLDQDSQSYGNTEKQKQQAQNNNLNEGDMQNQI